MYIPYYPVKDVSNRLVSPPSNLLFQFPFRHDVCFGFRLWVKLAYDDIIEDKEKFCQLYTPAVQSLNGSNFKRKKILKEKSSKKKS